MMIRAVLVAVMTLAGCGGPPFTLADEVSDGGAFPTPEAAPPGSDRADLPDRPGDDGGAASDARAPQIARPDGGAEDAAPAPASDGGPREGGPDVYVDPCLCMS